MSKNKKRDITALTLAIIIVILLNVVGSFVFHRFDLTSEKRYTLSDATKTLLKDLDDVVYVKVYLDGEFPAGFKRLRNETREMLNEFRAYADDNVEYEFINPSADPDQEQKKQVYNQLYEKGLRPTNLEVKEETGTTQSIIWPAAIVTYKGREAPWQLLKTQMSVSSEAQLNNSIQALEYEFASCIRNLSTQSRPKIAIIEKQRVADTLSMADIKFSLEEFYDVKRIAINEQLNALKGFKAIIIARPDTAFSEKDKFIIDQFIMNGGKVLWCIDPLETRLDSLAMTGKTLSTPYDLKLDDMLFKYGVRINPNMILDLQCSALPVNKSLRGQEPRFELMPWIFTPLILPPNKHPIEKNLDVIKFEFCASMDLIDAPGINKTILLTSSKNSKTISAPVRVNMNFMRIQPDEEQFKDSYMPVAVLLEGEFESVFRNRIKSKEILNDSAIAFKDHGVKTQMIVISDGDVIRNDVQYSNRKPYALGYDKYTNRTYGNKNFIMNCINYLCDDSGLISVRSRELTLRLLDKKKVNEEKTKWKIINTILPLLIVLAFGLVHNYRRKRKYS